MRRRCRAGQMLAMGTQESRWQWEGRSVEAWRYRLAGVGPRSLVLDARADGPAGAMGTRVSLWLGVCLGLQHRVVVPGQRELPGP